MKHKWEPSGIYQHKYCEAVCSVCNRQECSGADFCDEYKIKKFWLKIVKLDDCKGHKKEVKI
jgi:hypothetical protein